LLQAQEASLPPEPARLGAGDFPTTIDHITIRLSARWQDPRKDQLEGQLGFRYDATQDSAPVEEASVLLKALLPAPLLPWYVQSEVRADSTGSEAAAVSLGASFATPSDSRVATTVGLTTRDFRKHPRQRLRSWVVNWGVQWNYQEWLGVGWTVKYYVDVQDFEALLYLQLKPAVRAR
jgi:hypothetical protein